MSREVNLGIRDEFARYKYGGMGLRDEFARYGYGGMGYKDDPYWMGFKDDPYWMGFKDDPYWMGASYPDFLSQFNEAVARYNDLAQKAAALGPQQATTFNALVGQSIGVGRNPTGGLLSAIESIRFDIKHYPGKMDDAALKTIRAKLDILDGVVKSMTEQPAAPTQDGENERALQNAQEEVGKLLAEKQQLLARQVSGEVLGLSRKTWMWIGIGVAATGLVGFGVSRFAR